MEKIDWDKAPEDSTQEIMKSIISLTSYLPNGVLVWSGQVAKKDRAGMIAGTLNPSDGYRYVKHRGRKIGVHRVIFFMHHEYCPPEIDHINRVRDDNRIENLRDPINHTNNLGNQSHQIGRSSGFKGVCWDKNRNKWIASIKDARKTVFLGRFHDENEAAAAYNRAAIHLFGDFANINVLPGYRKP